MDSAYDAAPIHAHVESKGKVPVIDPNAKRNHSGVPLCPAKRERYKERTTIERVNSGLKDDFGGRQVRVKGHAKVFAHLMFGVLALTAERIVSVFT
jgi:IS5 family transposase